jgi:hypothetical protein
MRSCRYETLSSGAKPLRSQSERNIAAHIRDKIPNSVSIETETLANFDR